MTTLKRYATCESGATAIEYGLIAALICVVIIAGISAVGANVSTMYNKISTAVANANGK